MPKFGGIKQVSSSQSISSLFLVFSITISSFWGNIEIIKAEKTAVIRKYLKVGAAMLTVWQLDDHPNLRLTCVRCHSPCFLKVQVS